MVSAKAQIALFLLSGVTVSEIYLAITRKSALFYLMAAFTLFGALARACGL